MFTMEAMEDVDWSLHLKPWEYAMLAAALLVAVICTIIVVKTSLG